jgi:hypothetical protein
MRRAPPWMPTHWPAGGQPDRQDRQRGGCSRDCGPRHASTAAIDAIDVWSHHHFHTGHADDNSDGSRAAAVIGTRAGPSDTTADGRWRRG